MSELTGPNEQLKEKDEKKKRKKSLKSSDGKSKSSSRKSSDIPQSVENNEQITIDNDEVVSENEKIEAVSQINGEMDESISEKNLNPEKKKENPVDEEPVEKSDQEKNTITLREMDFRKLAELKEAFHLFDINQDGYIDKEDLKFTFTSMGKPNVSDEALDQMLSEMSSTAVDFDAFVKLFGYKAVELDSEEELLAALSKWDYLGNGMIPEETLKRDLQAWGDKFSAIEAEQALEEAPLYKKDETMMIDYVKFCHEICGLRNVEKTRQIEKEAEAYEKDLRSFVK